LRQLATAPASLYAVLSPMMACEEAWLLGKYLRSLDAKAVLVMGPAPAAGGDVVFKHYLTGQQTFVIKAEKVPNSAGIRRVMEMLGGPSATWADFVAPTSPQLKALKGGWIVGGYLGEWLPKDQPPQFKKGLRVVQDILPSALADAADFVLPAAAWAEKDGCWQNCQGRIQAFAATMAPGEDAKREGEVYWRLLGRDAAYDAAAVRREMAEPFAQVCLPSVHEPSPAFEFVEL
jgi:NADH-quinone oxidoreductase subunit G